MKDSAHAKQGQSSGLIYVFTGDGKGKTSAALGVAMRALGSGLRVGWVAWYKQASWRISEYELPRLLGKNNFRMYLMGKGFMIRQPGSGNRGIKSAPVGKKGQVVVDYATETEHTLAAEAALKKAYTLIGKVEVLVLDEVNNAVDEGLLDVAAVLTFLSQRGATHIILTGRNVNKKVVAVASLVTEMKKIKHPYDTGVLAVKGLDY